MKIKELFFDDSVKLISLDKHEDHRGFFYESYSLKKFEKIGIFENFIQDNMSFNKTKGTIRGLHYQNNPKAQSKLINIIHGSIQDIIVCIDKNSKFYGKHISVIMKSNNCEVLYIPQGYAHGFCTLENDTLLQYKVSNYYDPLFEQTILYNDKFLDIKWDKNINIFNISKKDKMGKNFITKKNV